MKSYKYILKTYPGMSIYDIDDLDFPRFLDLLGEDAGAEDVRRGPFRSWRDCARDFEERTGRKLMAPEDAPPQAPMTHDEIWASLAERLKG